MINLTEKWLATMPWDEIAKLNQSLCQEQKTTPHRPGPGHDAARQEWDAATNQTMTLLEALDLCRKMHHSNPFAFFNGNTFAKVASLLVANSLKNLPSLEAQIIRSSVAHYVAGAIKAGEFRKVCDSVGGLLNKNS